MNYQTQVYEFATKWLAKFRDQNISYVELVEHYLQEDCKALDFQMDCGQAFENEYGNAVHNTEALDKIIDEVTDIKLLGSAIYSRWRYFNCWAYDAAEILLPENRSWFILALSRLAMLTGENLFLFQVNLKEIRIVSNCLCYGPRPKPDEEVEQHITICSDGQAEASFYRFGDGIGHYIKYREEKNRIEEKRISQIFSFFKEYFSHEYVETLAKDIGNWDMELINTEGRVY